MNRVLRLRESESDRQSAMSQVGESAAYWWRKRLDLDGRLEEPSWPDREGSMNCFACDTRPEKKDMVDFWL